MGLGRDDLVLCTACVQPAPVLDRLALAQEHGFSAISLQPPEIRSVLDAGMTAAELRSRLADYGLTVSEVDAVTTWFPGQVPPEAWGPEMGAFLLSNTPDALCPLAESVGARSLTVVEFYGVDVDVDTATAGFAAVCDKAAEHGLLAHLEFLPWAGIPDLATAWQIVRNAGRPNGGLLVDSWHFFRSGSTFAELREIPGNRILYVQIDDAPLDPEPDLSDETQHRRLLPGEGDLDLVGLIRTLDEIGCQAPIGCEMFSDELAARPLDERVRRCAETTRSVVSAARR
jgi:sugar phosphate isomerase/epimerase